MEDLIPAGVGVDDTPLESRKRFIAVNSDFSSELNLETLLNKP